MNGSQVNSWVGSCDCPNLCNLTTMQHISAIMCNLEPLSLMPVSGRGTGSRSASGCLVKRGTCCMVGQPGTPLAMVPRNNVIQTLCCVRSRMRSPQPEQCSLPSEPHCSGCEGSSSGTSNSTMSRSHISRDPAQIRSWDIFPIIRSLFHKTRDVNPG